MDNEAQMARALEGHFFWAPRTGYEEDRTKAAREIRAAQKAFRKESSKKKEDIRRERAKRVLLERGKANIRRLPDGMSHVAAEIAKIYGIPKDVIMMQTRVELVKEARHHFLWALVRYFPRISIAQIGRFVGRHHSTVMHSRDYFEKVKHLHADNIAKLDEAVGYSG